MRTDDLLNAKTRFFEQLKKKTQINYLYNKIKQLTA